MGSRRQPSERFLRRLKGNGEPSKVEVPEIRPAGIRRFRESDWWLWAETIALVAVVVTIWHIGIDMKDRQTQRVVQAWQLVTQNAPGNSGKGPALEYLNSQGVPLMGIDLSAEGDNVGSYLRGVNLSKANLYKANLAGAAFDLANLSKANLYKANLAGASLDLANLSRAYLVEVNLSEADLSRANLSEVDLFHADMSGINLSPGPDLIQADLSRAYLLAVDLSQASLMSVDLSGANLTDADLWKANLAGADLTEANLTRAKLLNVDFRGTNLLNANLSGADLRYAKNLSQKMIDGACGDERTQLPQGLTLKRVGNCVSIKYDPLRYHRYRHPTTLRHWLDALRD